jgi:response regulator RpfG family c-di-GMP phosphodiesterase
MEWWVALPPHVRPAANRGFGWLGGCPLADPGLDPRGSGTILVVEDEPGVRAMLVRVLDVLRTANEPSRVRLVISDQAMPIMDGATLAERIAAEWPALPLLVVSGHPAERVSRENEASSLR